MVFSVLRVLRGELFNDNEVLVIKRFMKMVLIEVEKMDFGKVIFILVFKKMLWLVILFIY